MLGVGTRRRTSLAPMALGRCRRECRSGIVRYGKEEAEADQWDSPTTIA